MYLPLYGNLVRIKNDTYYSGDVLDLISSVVSSIVQRLGLANLFDHVLAGLRLFHIQKIRIFCGSFSPQIYSVPWP